MWSVITHDDGWRWRLEIDSASGSSWCWLCVSSTGKENKDGGKLHSFRGMFFASIKSIQHLSAVRGHVHNRQGVFAINLLFEFHLEWESVVWPHNNATFVELSSSHSFFSSFSLEWVLIIFRNNIHFSKVRMPQFHKWKEKLHIL